jgi:hypothetical protein
MKTVASYRLAILLALLYLGLGTYVSFLNTKPTIETSTYYTHCQSDGHHCIQEYRACTITVMIPFNTNSFPHIQHHTTDLSIPSYDGYSSNHPCRYSSRHHFKSNLTIVQAHTEVCTHVQSVDIFLSNHLHVYTCNTMYNL